MHAEKKDPALTSVESKGGDMAREKGSSVKVSRRDSVMGAAPGGGLLAGALGNNTTSVCCTR
jgi:hypothetical protein